MTVRVLPGVKKDGFSVALQRLISGQGVRSKQEVCCGTHEPWLWWLKSPCWAAGGLPGSPVLGMFGPRKPAGRICQRLECEPSQRAHRSQRERGRRSQRLMRPQPRPLEDGSVLCDTTVLESHGGQEPGCWPGTAQVESCTASY